MQRKKTILIVDDVSINIDLLNGNKIRRASKYEEHAEMINFSSN